MHLSSVSGDDNQTGGCDGRAPPPAAPLFDGAATPRPPLFAAAAGPPPRQHRRLALFIDTSSSLTTLRAESGCVLLSASFTMGFMVSHSAADKTQRAAPC